MTAAIHSDRNNGSCIGAQAEAIGLRGKLPAIGVFTPAAILIRRDLANRNWQALSERPIPISPGPNKVDQEARHEDNGCIADLLYEVLARNENEYESEARDQRRQDRKSTRLNSSHGYISYAVFCLKKKKKIDRHASS